MNENTQAPEVEPTNCTRAAGHEGPCNGWPCATAQAKMTEPIPVAAKVSPMTADDIRSKIVEQFTTFQPHMKAYADYAERIAALSVAYHDSRLSDVTGLPVEEGVLLIALDARATPKSLDEKLAQIGSMPEAKIRRIIFDRTKSTYYLFL